MFYFSFISYFFFSFIFSMSEAARFALRDTSGLSKNATLFNTAKDGAESLVLGNNVANVLVGQILAQQVSHILPLWAQGLPWAVFMFFATVLVGESIPKKIGESFPDRVLNTVSPLLLGARYLLAPLSIVLAWVNSLLPSPQVNEEEEELVEAAMALDSTPVLKLPLKELGNELEWYNHEWLFAGDVVPAATTIDKVVPKLREGKELLVLDDRNIPAGIATQETLFKWMFDHLE